MYKGAIQYSKLTVFLVFFFFFLFFFLFFLQNDVEAPAYLRTPGYAPERRQASLISLNTALLTDY